ncbi:MAG TPA: hypothetical protein VF590_13350, partial [Isosphaeraceae bacterium]
MIRDGNWLEWLNPVESNETWDRPEGDVTSAPIGNEVASMNRVVPITRRLAPAALALFGCVAAPPSVAD